VCTLYPKEHIVLHLRKLQLLLTEFGAEALLKVHRVLAIPSKRWPKPFVDAFVPALSKAVADGDKPTVAACKACFVSAVGSLNHAVENYTKQKCFLSSKFNAAARKKDGSPAMSLTRKYAEKPTFRGAELLGEFTVLEMAQQRPLLAELTAAYAAIVSDCCVLLSTRVLELLKMFPGTLSLYSDTDSAYLYITSDVDPMVRVAHDCCWFDAGKQGDGFWERYTAAYGEEAAAARQSQSMGERGAIGMMGDVAEGEVFESFVCSAPKSYALTGGKGVLRGAARNVAGASAADLARGLLGQAPVVLERTTTRTTGDAVQQTQGTLRVGRFVARNCLVAANGESCALGDKSARGTGIALAQAQMCCCEETEPLCVRCKLH
jgi:hypothetical protein